MDNIQQIERQKITGTGVAFDRRRYVLTTVNRRKEQ